MEYLAIERFRCRQIRDVQKYQREAQTGCANECLS